MTCPDCGKKMEDWCPCGLHIEDSLERAVKDFFKILDIEEESMNERRFHPVTISSCRVQLTEELETILKRMKKYVQD